MRWEGWASACWWSRCLARSGTGGGVKHSWLTDRCSYTRHCFVPPASQAAQRKAVINMSRCPALHNCTMADVSRNCPSGLQPCWNFQPGKRQKLYKDFFATVAVYCLLFLCACSRSKFWLMQCNDAKQRRLSGKIERRRAMEGSR